MRPANASRPNPHIVSFALERNRKFSGAVELAFTGVQGKEGVMHEGNSKWAAWQSKTEMRKLWLEYQEFGFGICEIRT